LDIPCSSSNSSKHRGRSSSKQHWLSNHWHHSGCRSSSSCLIATITAYSSSSGASKIGLRATSVIVKLRSILSVAFVVGVSIWPTLCLLAARFSLSAWYFATAAVHLALLHLLRHMSSHTNLAACSSFCYFLPVAMNPSAAQKRKLLRLIFLDCIGVLVVKVFLMAQGPINSELARGNSN
jgi:hypothetical protein